MTYLAYHLHWDLSTLLDLEHRDRLTVADEVAGLNEQVWEGLRTRG